MVHKDERADHAAQSERQDALDVHFWRQSRRTGFNNQIEHNGMSNNVKRYAIYEFKRICGESPPFLGLGAGMAFEIVANGVRAKGVLRSFRRIPVTFVN